LGDACFVMMTPVSQEMGPPVNPVRFNVKECRADPLTHLGRS
jgi:hypothetical protein